MSKSFSRRDFLILATATAGAVALGSSVENVSPIWEIVQTYETPNGDIVEVRRDQHGKHPDELYVNDVKVSGASNIEPGAQIQLLNSDQLHVAFEERCLLIEPNELQSSIDSGDFYFTVTGRATVYGEDGQELERSHPLLFSAKRVANEGGVSFDIGFNAPLHQSQ